MRAHDPVYRRLSQLPQHLLPFPLQRWPGDPCPPSAAGCTQAKTSSPSAPNPRSDILDSAPPSLVCMEQRPGYRQTGNRCDLALGWLSIVLALSIAAKESWQAKDRCGASSSHPEDGGGESERGAPRIHGELLKLGFDVSERTVSRYLRRLYSRDHARKLWAAFLRNHRESSWPWISSPCRPSPSESCIVSL